MEACRLCPVLPCFPPINRARRTTLMPNALLKQSFLSIDYADILTRTASMHGRNNGEVSRPDQGRNRGNGRKSDRARGELSAGAKAARRGTFGGLRILINHSAYGLAGLPRSPSSPAWGMTFRRRSRPSISTRSAILRPPPLAPPTPRPVARLRSSASQLLWRSPTWPVRAGCGSSPSRRAPASRVGRRPLNSSPKPRDRGRGSSPPPSAGRGPVCGWI